MSKKISFEDMPVVVSQLVDEVHTLSRNVSTLSKKIDDHISQTLPTVQGQRILTTDQVCAMLHRSRHNVYQLVSKGDLPCFKKGKYLMFFEDDVHTWIQSSGDGF